jgi:hypothetical protein
MWWKPRASPPMWSGSWGEKQCVVWRECSKRPALGSVYTRSSSAACAFIVCVNYYITKYHITTTDICHTGYADGCLKQVELYSKNKFEKLFNLVGFIIRMHHDARSSECQTPLPPTPVTLFFYGSNIPLNVTLEHPQTLFFRLCRWQSLTPL